MSNLEVGAAPLHESDVLRESLEEAIFADARIIRNTLCQLPNNSPQKPILTNYAELALEGFDAPYDPRGRGWVFHDVEIGVWPKLLGRKEQRHLAIADSLKSNDPATLPIGVAYVASVANTDPQSMVRSLYLDTLRYVVSPEKGRIVSVDPQGSTAHDVRTGPRAMHDLPYLRVILQDIAESL